MQKHDSIHEQPHSVDGRVLLVEDDDQTRRLMSRLLAGVGIDVRCASTVKDAVVALASMPALVVLDLKLPDGCGTEVLREIRESGMRCKVAVVSGVAEPDLFVTLRELQPDAIFGKPLDFEDFTDWLCEAFPAEMLEAA